MGSTPPNRIASTTYIGAMKSSPSQTTPGTASSGQSHRAPRGPAASATGLELLPDLVVRRVGRRRQLQQRDPGVEVLLLHHRGREVRRHVAVGDQLVRGELQQRRLVAGEGE